MTCTCLLLTLLLTCSLASRITISIDPGAAAAVTGAGSFADGSTLVHTLAAAQSALRTALAAYGGDLDVDIHLMGGTHRVPRGGLLLTAADTPALGRRVRWLGAATGSAIISGGENVTGWAPANDPALPATVVAAPIPAALRGGSSRQLYVDGARARRTSRPASAVLPGLTLESRAHCTACSYEAATATPLAWSNPGDVEFVYAGVGGSSWSEPRCAVLNVSAASPGDLPNCTLVPGNEADCGFPYSTEAQCVNNRTAAHPLGCCWHDGGAAPSGHFCVAPAFPGGTPATRITMAQPCLWNLVNRPYQPAGGAPATSVENVREHLDAPGQWYLDRARGVVLYYPLPGQDMAAATAVIAVEEALLTLHGARRQSFANLTYAYATWLRPGHGAGFVEQQSAACNVCPYGVTMGALCGANDTYAVTPGNVALVGATDVDFFGCAFTHLGAYGASARGGSQNVSFRWSAFSDTSAGALMLGDTESADVRDPAAWDAGLTVSDCSMAGAVEYSGATTLFAAYVSGLTVEHNDIFNASYSGMTVGWGWGREAAPGRGGNRILCNRVRGVQTVRCCDGGGIYTLGPQPGSILSGNYVAQGAAAGAWGPAAGNAVYHDNGSAGFDDGSNVVDGTWGAYLFINDSAGAFGPGAACPGADGAPADCGMRFVGNWIRSDAHGTTAHVNSTIANNTHIAPGAPLPPDAAAVAAAAGPRY